MSTTPKRPLRSRLRFLLSQARRDEGIAAVEFALVAPLFIVLAFGILVFSLYIGTRFAITEAAAEGARASVAGGSATERASLAQARAQAVIQSYAPMLSLANAVITTSTPSNGIFAVTITYNRAALGLTQYASLLPLPSSNATATATVSNGGY